MTSTEFAARYRLLKNVANRGARSFLAQQVELGRMVMVHYLDSESPEQRASTLARLRALREPARNKLMEIAEVDGAPVAVTLFIVSFVDFGTWLDQVSDPVAPEPEFVSEPPAASAPPPPQTPIPQRYPAAPEQAPGEFTQLFNALKSPAPAAPAAIGGESLPAEVARPNTPGEFTGFFGAMGSAPSAAPPKSSSPFVPPAPAPAKGAESFTAIFGAISPSAPSDVPGGFSIPRQHEQPNWPPQPQPAALGFTPPESAPEPHHAAPPPPVFDSLRTPSPQSGPAAESEGELTRMFRQMSAAMPLATARAAEPPVLPPPPESSFGDQPSKVPPALADVSLSPPSMLPPPSLGAAPPSPNVGAMFGNADAPSEYTRILRGITLPPPPPVVIQAPGPEATSAAEKKPRKPMLPLIIGLGAIGLLTIAIVVYFVFGR